MIDLKSLLYNQTLLSKLSGANVFNETFWILIGFVYVLGVIFELRSGVSEGDGVTQRAVNSILSLLILSVLLYLLHDIPFELGNSTYKTTLGIFEFMGGKSFFGAGEYKALIENLKSQRHPEFETSVFTILSVSAIPSALLVACWIILKILFIVLKLLYTLTFIQLVFLSIIPSLASILPWFKSATEGIFSTFFTLFFFPMVIGLLMAAMDVSIAITSTKTDGDLIFRIEEVLTIIIFMLIMFGSYFMTAKLLKGQGFESTAGMISGIVGPSAAMKVAGFGAKTLGYGAAIAGGGPLAIAAGSMTNGLLKFASNIAPYSPTAAGVVASTAGVSKGLWKAAHKYGKIRSEKGAMWKKIKEASDDYEVKSVKDHLSAIKEYKVDKNKSKSASSDENSSHGRGTDSGHFHDSGFANVPKIKSVADRVNDLNAKRSSELETVGSNNKKKKSKNKYAKSTFRYDPKYWKSIGEGHRQGIREKFGITTDTPIPGKTYKAVQRARYYTDDEAERLKNLRKLQLNRKGKS